MTDSTGTLERDPGAAARQFDRRNPMTGEVASSAPAHNADEARAAADAAAAAFPAWSALGPNPRRALLNKAAVALAVIPSASFRRCSTRHPRKRRSRR